MISNFLKRVDDKLKKKFSELRYTIHKNLFLKPIKKSACLLLIVLHNLFKFFYKSDFFSVI